VAISPREPPYFDSGATHGPTIHRLSSGTYALYYMGAANTWGRNGSHPNCTAALDPEMGSHSTRRIGVATSSSLFGPWERRDEPIFGPGDKSDWDYLDVSNPTPIIFRNGTTLMLYKGRGSVQAMGVAVAPRFDGPFVRSKRLAVVPGEDTWGWIAPATSDGATETLHTFTHDGNGATSAGGHAWSLDGLTWRSTSPAAYTGAVSWASGGGTSTTILARRERPQVLLRPAPGEVDGSSYGWPERICTSAENVTCRHDGGPGTSACRSYTICQPVNLRRFSF
jgi:hypothetical protein